MHIMEANIIAYIVALLAGMLTMVYITYEEKVTSGELEPRSFNKKYLLPAFITGLAILPVLETHFLSVTVPTAVSPAIFEGFMAGFALEIAWRIALKAFLIATTKVKT